MTNGRGSAKVKTALRRADRNHSSDLASYVCLLRDPDLVERVRAVAATV